MSFDYYAYLDTKNKAGSKSLNGWDLASGFVDECTVQFYRNAASEEQNKSSESNSKNEVRKDYMKRAKELEPEKLKPDLPNVLFSNPDFSSLPDPAWFGIKVVFKLETSWYSKDDRPFHVLDNPVRKDRVFGVPFMSAASWKGLLRWACRMNSGLFKHLGSHDMKKNGWKDPPWIVHLFGNEKEEDKHFKSGALACYPTWFNEIGFEVINPHERAKKAGKQPIYYEVVPSGATGEMCLLYAPLPGEVENDRIGPLDFIGDLIGSIEALLERYGISAKRTAGWGTASITEWKGFVKSPGQSVKTEELPLQKTLKSLQELGSQVSQHTTPDCFCSVRAKEFKVEMRKRLAVKEGSL